MTKNNAKVNIPGYRIIRKIGEGGMSVVYLAYQESLKREVALKVMRPIITDEENVVRRFEQEAEIIAKLYHPNIVNIYEVGHIDDDVLYYSMPYLQHGDLTTFTYNNDDELKVVMSGICEGLAFAHTQGVVHRDIKPENILFDQFGHVQIADFGIALSTGRRRFTRENRIVGSIHYMSPEQAQSKHVDARSDIYGLGAILYEILTGDPVFEEEDDLSLMMAHVNQKIPQLPAHLSQWQAVIDKCLAKSPNHRFQKMTDLKQAVLAVQKQSPKQKQSIYYVTATILTVMVLASVFVWYWMAPEPVIEQNVQPAEVPINVERVVENNLSDDAINPSTEQAPEAEVVNNLSPEQVESLLKSAQRNIAEKQLTTPRENNALDQLLNLLANIPDHVQAQSLLSDVMAGYYELLYQAVQNNDLDTARTFADSVSEVRHRTILVNEDLLTQLEKNTDLERSLMIGAVVEKINRAKKTMNRQLAREYIELVDQVIPGQELVDELLNSISSMLKPGQILTDDMGIKTTVVTPQYNSKKGLLNYGLAVTQSEVTVAQYDRFVKATDRSLKRCKSELKVNMIFSQRNFTKPGFRVEQDMPVVCVTWQDANQYAIWLSQQTGLSYRLPSKREWQHLLRLSDHEIKCGESNLAGTEFPDDNDEMVLYGCDDGNAHIAPINDYRPNKIGLLGLHGNASEWLSGCEKLGKFKAIFNPDDLCDNNPIIGRSWLSDINDSGEVKQIDFDDAWTHIGFRLVRDLRKEQ